VSAPTVRRALSPADIQRFWSHVQRSGGPDSCWEWQRCRHWKGYGQVNLAAWRGASHRLAFEIANGRPAVGLVRHTCDNPPCCNPAHLAEGSAADNTRDMMHRNRHVRVVNEANGRTRFTVEQIREIRARNAAGESVRALAIEYGMNENYLRAIRNGRRRKDAA
jgi:hypothetical protein